MAHFSTQCIDCTDCAKQYSGEYSAKDEDGKRFSGKMVLCDNSACRVNIERQRGEKQYHALEANGLRAARSPAGARKRTAVQRRGKTS